MYLNRNAATSLEMSRTLQCSFSGRKTANAVRENKSRQTRCSLRNGSGKAWVPMTRSQALINQQRKAVAEELVVADNKITDPRVDTLETAQRVETAEPLQWWEQRAENFNCVATPEELVSQIVGAANFERLGDGKEQLVVVEFYSTQCGACRSLAPKLKQIAEQNPEVTFLKFNYAQHMQLCRSIDVRVLPLMQFYKGAELLDRFACSLQPAHLKRFRRALDKYGAPSCAIRKPPIVDVCADECFLTDSFKSSSQNIQRVLEYMSSARSHVEL